MARSKRDDRSLDFWESLGTTKQHLFSLAFLFILPLFLYHATILGGQQYMGTDVIQWRAGAESLIEHREIYDEVAHWATNMFSGMPANTISHPPQVYNLDNTILDALSSIYPAAEIWILLAGAYFMFILIGLRPLAAVTGAVLIGFTTYIPIIIGAGHNAKFLAYIYVPWLYFGYFLITRTDKNRWLSFFLFALAITLHLRAFHPQVTYYFLFPLGAVFIYDGIRKFQSGEGRTFLFQTGLLIGAAVVAVLITAQIYWSTMEYSSFSMRGGSQLAGTEGLSRNYAFAWSQGWGELLTLLIPGAYGGSELYWGPKSFTSGPHYFGAAALILFLFGLINSGRKLKYLFLVPGAAAVLFSLGENFTLLNNFMFDYFPYFDKFRVPETWLMMAVFCFSAVAAFGADWLLENLSNEKKNKEWRVPALTAAAISLIAIFTVFQFLSYEKPGERSQIAQQIAQQNNVPLEDPRVGQTVGRIMQTQLIPERRDLAEGDATRFGIIVVLGLALVWGMATKKIPASAGLIGFSLILAYDLIRVDSRYLSENSLVDQELTAADVIERRERPIDRFIQENVPHEEGWEYRVLPLLDNAFNNAIPSYFYPSAGGYSGAKLSYYQDLIDQAFFTGGISINESLMDLLNIRYITIGQRMQLPGSEIVYEGEDGVVLENLDVLPKAFFVDSVATLPNETDVYNQVSIDFEPTEVAYIAGDREVGTAPDSLASISVEEYNANTIRLSVSRTQPGFLVLSEIWYPPGWTITLNGEETEMIRTNYAVRGFEIPPGDHKLEMRLEPAWYTTGRWMAIAGSLLLFGAGFMGLFGVYRSRKEETE